MRPVTLALMFMSCAVLASCAHSTGILPAGPNTYTITGRFAPVRGGGDEAEKVVLTKANDFCAGQGRQFVPTMMDPSGNPLNPYGPTGHTVTFTCLLPNDPALAAYQI
jgi:hypothetical protein